MRKVSFNLCVCLLLLAVSLPSWADEGVIVVLKNGNTVGFSFAEKPVIETGESLILRTPSGKSVSYAYDNVRKVFWGDNTTTAIDNAKSVTTPNVRFRIMTDAIEVCGLAPGEWAGLYTTSGSLVTSVASVSDGSVVTLSLPVGQRAVYIVRTSRGISYKFTNR